MPILLEERDGKLIAYPLSQDQKVLMQFSDDEFDTVGGLVMSAFGHLPKRNETTEIGPYRFRILNADSRRIHLLRLTPVTR